MNRNNNSWLYKILYSVSITVLLMLTPIGINAEEIDIEKISNNDNIVEIFSEHEEVNEETPIEEVLEEQINEIETSELEVNFVEDEENTELEKSEDEVHNDDQVKLEDKADSGEVNEEESTENVLSKFEIISEIDLNYIAFQKTKNIIFYSYPDTRFDEYVLDSAQLTIPSELMIVQEAETEEGTWSKVKLSGDLFVWVLKDDVFITEIMNLDSVNYRGYVNQSGSTLTSKPLGTYDYEYIYELEDTNIRQEVIITKEAITDRGKSLFITLLGTNISGWVEENTINLEAVSSSKTIRYRARLNRFGDTINNAPWGTKGFRELYKTTQGDIGKEVEVSIEATTQRSNWAKVTILGTNISGWIDISALNIEKILESNPINYRARINRSRDTFSTQPWGSYGFEEIFMNTGNEIAKEVEVTYEAKTSRAEWAYARILGTNIEGWIDKTALNIEKITNLSNIRYRAKLIRSNDTLSSQPWGSYGYEVRYKTGNSDLGKEIEIVKEARTSRAEWVYAKILGTNIEGWIDKKALEIEQITSSQNIHYRAHLIRQGDTISTQPWGSYDFIEKYKTLSIDIGRELVISKEATTPRANWAYANILGTDISGWIDKRAFASESIISEKNVNYTAYFKRSGDTMSTQPWGTRGYSDVYRTVNSNLWQKVQVTKEAKTQRADWAYITIIGTNIKGWIDKNAVSDKIVVYLDAGHGGSDSGAYYYGIHEKDINLAITNKIRSRLINNGYEVIMSRTNDKTLGLYERPADANAKNADIFISIHNNAMPGNSSVRGVETYYYEYAHGDTYKPKYPVGSVEYNKAISHARSRESKKLADSIHRQIVNYTGAPDRGVREMGFAVIRETFMPGILLEFGYVSNYSEAQKLITDSYQNTLADSVVHGLNNYFML